MSSSALFIIYHCFFFGLSLCCCCSVRASNIERFNSHFEWEKSGKARNYILGAMTVYHESSHYGASQLSDAPNYGPNYSRLHAVLATDCEKTIMNRRMNLLANYHRLKLSTYCGCRNVALTFRNLGLRTCSASDYSQCTVFDNNHTSSNVNLLTLVSVDCSLLAICWHCCQWVACCAMHRVQQNYDKRTAVSDM